MNITSANPMNNPPEAQDTAKDAAYLALVHWNRSIEERKTQEVKDALTFARKRALLFETRCVLAGLACNLLILLAGFVTGYLTGKSP